MTLNGVKRDVLVACLKADLRVSSDLSDMKMAREGSMFGRGESRTIFYLEPLSSPVQTGF